MIRVTVPYRADPEKRDDKGFSGLAFLEVEQVPWGHVYTVRLSKSGPLMFEFCLTNADLQTIAQTLF